MLNIPNSISLLRICLVPVVVWLIITDQIQAAFGIFVLAGLSDAVDGFIAKRYGMKTELGAYLDPLADKLLLVSIYIALGLLGEIPSWLVILIVSRDVLIISGFLLSWVLEHPFAIDPAYVSKINTALQILLAAVVLGDMAFGLDLNGMKSLLIYVTGTLTLLSAATYLLNWLQHMSDYEDG